MFDLPCGIPELEQVGIYADWAELCALFSRSGTCSGDSAAELLLDSGLMGLAEEEYPPGASPSFVDDSVLSPSDAAGGFAEEIWRELEKRVRRLGENYPFVVEGRLIKRRDDEWTEHAAYAMLLIADVGRSYPDSSVNITPNAHSGRLFEKIVEAAARGILRGTCQRFGWPREPGWPTGIDERIKILGSSLSLHLENLDGKTNPTDKDRGLDVVARLDLGDDHAGSVFVLIQCAAGGNWREKCGEPQIENWRDLLQWGSCLIRGVALPWTIPSEGLWDYRRHFRHFDGALVLDRMRLSYVGPDGLLEEEPRAEIVEWCQDRIDEIPRVA